MSRSNSSAAMFPDTGLMAVNPTPTRLPITYLILGAEHGVVKQVGCFGWRWVVVRPGAHHS